MEREEEVVQVDAIRVVVVEELQVTAENVAIFVIIGEIFFRIMVKYVTIVGDGEVCHINPARQIMFSQK